MFHPNISIEKIQDAQEIADKLSKLDRETQIYIQGRVDQALEDQNRPA